MNRDRNRYDVIVAGAGPAGTSAAIHLATNGVSVLLAEQKKFPRPKLCGEFISPECWDHFAHLGVADQMTASGGTALRKAVFYSRGGHSVSVPSEWFGGVHALGLSRAEMDNNLLIRARECGVTVLEETQACGLVLNEGIVRGVSLKLPRGQHDYFAEVTIDATGRTRALARRFDQLSKTGRKRTKRQLVAFKAHLRNAQVAEGVSEIYSYPGGYGGLNAVEGDLSNLCFIVSARDVRRCESDPERLVREVVSKNSRAAFALKDAHTETSWLSVSLEGFGRHRLVPANGLLTAGDAAAFIDPFTGSGMLMALESGALAAEVILNYLHDLGQHRSFQSLADDYRVAYARKFDSRLRVCKWLRRAAFVPQLAEATILFFSNDWLRERLSRAVRKGSRDAAKLQLDQTLNT